MSDPAELDRAVIWLSHIFFRYESPGPDVVPLSNGDWSHPKRTWPQRSKALDQAREIRRVIERDPSEFERLASQFSDDPTTAYLGGSLGGMVATELIRAFPR